MSLSKYYIFINAFWQGFTEGTNMEFFENVFKKTKLSNYEITNDITKANVLFESLFGNTLVNYKKWAYKIHYSGEPYSSDNSNYDLVLNSAETNKNVVDIPLSVYYIHENNLLDTLINKPVITHIPENFCCFIVSNGGCKVRNEMFNKLNKYKKVDSCGNYANNMGFNLKCGFSSKEFHQFLSSYKFIICFENTKISTYSTEKIVNPLVARTIPIYWSSQHVKNIFNSESMLFLEDETDVGYEKLINDIIELDNSDTKYLEFINKPVFSNMNYWNSNYTIEKIANKINQVLN